MSMRFSLVLMAIVSVGCGTPAAGSEAASAPATATPVEPAPTDPLERAVVAEATPILHGMQGEAPFEHGVLEEHSPVERTLVLDRGRCYRIVAVAESSIADLELALYDSNAVMVQRDSRHDSIAMIGGEEAICPQEAGAYRLEARAGRGQGAYALRIYASRH